MYRSRDFDIILDCTSFTSKSEVPLQWLKYCAEVIPMDIRVRFSTTRILNANTLTQKYLRRLYNISAGVSVYLIVTVLSRLWEPGTRLCNEIKAYTSVLQLLEDVETAALPSLAFAGIDFFSINIYLWANKKVWSLVRTGRSRKFYWCYDENFYAGARSIKGWLFSYTSLISKFKWRLSFPEVSLIDNRWNRFLYLRDCHANQWI